ncbi:MAG: hypothetical protein ABIR94_09455 [Rubrivivax sp.]
MNSRPPTPSQLIAAANGQVQSSDGWTIRPVNADLLEYACGPAACLINIGHASLRSLRSLRSLPSSHGRARPIYASESRSELFPDLCENVRLALPFLKGSFVVV